jgi:hypothetical protein
MTTLESKWRDLVRTVACLGGGIFLSFVLPAILDKLLEPNLPHLIMEAARTPREQLQSSEAWRELQHSASVVVYVLDPLVGIGVGTFIGLLQKRRPVILAVLCLVPSYLVELLTDHRRSWAASGSGILHYLFNHSLPFIAAIVAVSLSRYLTNYLRQRRDDPEPGVA